MTKPIYSIAKEIPMPEDLQKMKTRNLGREKARIESARALAKKRTVQRRESAKRASQYEKEYKRVAADLNNQRITAHSNGRFFAESEEKLAFVVRLRGLKSILPKAKKALQLLRLRQINNGVFIRLNKATLNMLKLVEPYVAWGYPSLETVRKLVYKRGYGKVQGDRIALTSNNIIADKLGKQNVICMEDIIHEIYTVGPNFKAVNNFLWPFKLSHPNGGYNSIKKHYVQGGDFGNRETAMNDLLERML